MSGPSLSQRQSMKMGHVMAPQMRQSLNMLQLTRMELHALVARELEQNPTLDETAPEMEQIELEGDVAGEITDEADAELMEDYEKLAQIDEDWREYFRNNKVVTGGTEAEAKRNHMMNSLRQNTSLQEHLEQQLGMLDLDVPDMEIGRLLIGCIDDDGFLNTPIDELVETGFERDTLEDILGLIQTFDPVGVGAKDLRDCLLIQLERRGEVESVAHEIVESHLQALGSRKLPDIAHALGIGIDDVVNAAEKIAGLEPKPGRSFASETANYVMPEVFVDIEGGEYVVHLNNEHIPNLRISRHYRTVIEDANTTKETRRYLIEKVKSGEFMIRSLHQRQETIRSIAEEIVRLQTPFLDEGVDKLRPLTMAEVADKIGKHETTVSRAIANKYISTPRGVFEMKYFFTPGFTNKDGGSVSNEAIKTAIFDLVEAENKKKPLSDAAMVKILAERGIKIARRTVTKYREELKILASHMRKEF